MSRVARFLIVTSVLAGCLEAGPPPEGRRLSAERDVQNIGIVEVDGEAWVEFQSIKRKATPPLKAAVELHQISSDGSRQRVLAASLKEGSLGAVSDGRWALVDEEAVQDEVERRYGNTTVATLVHIGSQMEIDLRIPNVSSYTLAYDRLVYRRSASGGEAAALRLRVGENDRELLPSPASSVISVDIRASGAIYLKSSDDSILKRLPTPDGQIENVREHVSRYLLRDDDVWMAVADTSSGKTKALLVNLQTGVELPLARANPCCWNGFDGDRFRYIHASVDDNPAEYHVLDLTTGQDDSTLMPDNLVDVSSIIDRRNSDEALYVDSQGHGAFLGRDDKRLRRKVEQRLTAPFFSPDGRYLLYVDLAPITAIETVPHGPLMAQDSELAAPPRRISPPGLDIPLDPQSGGRPFFMGDEDKPILVFWARFGHSTSDLYFADVETGQLRLVAQSIRDVTVSPDGYFGIVNVSQQDLVGDLVLRDLAQDKARVLSQAVAGFHRRGDNVAFLVRGRVSSDRDGLWFASLKPAVTDGGAP